MNIFGYEFFGKKKKEEIGTLPEGCQIKVVDRRAITQSLSVSTALRFWIAVQ